MFIEHFHHSTSPSNHSLGGRKTIPVRSSLSARWPQNSTWRRDEAVLGRASIRGAEVASFFPSDFTSSISSLGCARSYLVSSLVIFNTIFDDVLATFLEKDAPFGNALSCFTGFEIYLLRIFTVTYFNDIRAFKTMSRRETTAGDYACSPVQQASEVPTTSLPHNICYTLISSSCIWYCCTCPILLFFCSLTDLLIVISR